MRLIYKLIFLISMILSSGISLVYAEADSDNKSFFNPEDTWEYFFVDYNYPTPTDELYVSTSKLQLFYVGDEVREGKQYKRFNWRFPNSIPFDSYFLLREEDGAYYGYIDQSPEQSRHAPDNTLKGEFLLYDFNMEEGASYIVPYALKFFRGNSTALQPDNCETGVFKVVKKEIDDQGRRVLTMITDFNPPEYLFTDPIKIVEGIGPISSESNLAAFLFSYYAPSLNPQPYFRFFRVLNQDNGVVFLSPQEKDAGFYDEMDYEWVYGVLSPDGKVSYMKAIFNDLLDWEGHFYRRFICTYQDQDWYKIKEGKVYYFREADNSVCLLHQEGTLGLYYDCSMPIIESLIYDFGAADGSELTFYSPEGELTKLITAGFTEVDGEQRRSYTFDGSDGVTCVEGIGIIKGGILPVVNSEFRLPAADEKDTYVGAALVAVYDGDGNLIFSQEMPSGVETISAADGFTAPADRIFDLQGRELSEPIPGQPYIKGGHIFLEK